MEGTPQGPSLTLSEQAEGWAKMSLCVSAFHTQSMSLFWKAKIWKPTWMDQVEKNKTKQSISVRLRQFVRLLSIVRHVYTSFSFAVGLLSGPDQALFLDRLDFFTVSIFFFILSLTNSKAAMNTEVTFTFWMKEPGCSNLCVCASPSAAWWPTWRGDHGSALGSPEGGPQE